MTYAQLITTAGAEVGYHEKRSGTPEPLLYPPQNSYDGSDNWTKYHNDIGIAQGSPWCGFFCFWCFRHILGTNAQATNFLHGISSYGGAVSSWALAFTPYGEYHEGSYTPKPGDLVIFSDVDSGGNPIPWAHIEIVTDVSDWPTYLGTVGGNTRNPNDPGDQSEGMWVARRIRDATATTGFHIRGFCEVVYDNYPTGTSGLIVRKRRYTAFG